MIEPETIIDGRYRVISRVGSGGMADVYLARDELLGREVAVKVLHQHFADDQEFVERFRREASSAAALSHPNIVAIFDRGEWNGTYYIAMEYVAGRTLKAVIREDGPIEPTPAIDIVVQILRAARFAHKRGVIHRDLKPHNVILDEEGRARVTDFGIARAGASDMTMTGSIMGTAQYLSPEQAQGYAVTGASDLYSVGVILYELLTGAVPFEGESAVAIAYKQVAAAPRPPSELNPAIPASLDAIVMRALAKDPGERYADADELIAVLERERQALPAHATVFAGPPPAAAPPVPAALPPAYAELPPDPDAERRRKMWIWAGAIAAAIAVAVLLWILLSPSSGKITVPDVTGQTEAQAVEELHRAGLTPVPSLGSSATVEAGHVISQTPSAGTDVSKNAQVRFIVSGGPATVALPSVAGQSEAEATEHLKKAGFKPTTREQSSSNIQQGRVIATDPPAGTVTQVGSSVTVIVSSGPAQVRVPDLAGQSQEAAEAALTNAGLSTGTVTKKETTSQTAGTVVSQAPSGGTNVRAGEKVDLTVAQAPKEAAVPAVVGKKEGEAYSALEQAGFKVSTQSVATSETSQVGVVLRQSPSAGKNAARGSTVTIGVGSYTAPTTPTTTTPTTPTPPAAVTPGGP